ncbi:hypothetical protein Taro_020110 [Colocasia esculenta]|uniref:Uncharacterized protein n=1 Tax=Colocasia esculenta TaxID=4460 RepID=A0A843V494_COLES|nr:hypothetical protein [Colocasia esculenta]
MMMLILLSANERDVRYESYDYTLPTDYNPWSIGYGGGSSQYPFMPITDHSHTFHSASSLGWHRRTDYIIPLDEETAGIGRVEYMSWYWSITRRYIGQPGFTYDMHYEPRDHIDRSLVEGMKYLHMMATDGLQDDMISDSTQSRYIAMQMYIDSVLSQVQQTDSSTSDVGPSEPCADTPQQPDDAGPPQFSPDVMTVSQYGLYDVGASQLLIDEGMPDTQPPQSNSRYILSPATSQRFD